jgi:hypothetical protein
MAALATLCCSTASAYADGSPTIAGAPPVAWAQRESGNTLNGIRDSEGVYYSFWALRVTRTDIVTLEWEAAEYTAGVYPEVHVYPVGATDRNYRQVPEAEYHLQSLGPSGQDTFTFTAPRTGVMTLAFISDGGCCSGRPGPYTFVARVTGPQPPADPCSVSHGTLAYDLLQSLKCTARSTALEVKCGVSLATTFLPALRSLKLIEAARGAAAIDRLPAAVRPAAKTLYDIYHARYLPRAPAGFRSGAEAVATIRKLKLKAAYELMRDLPDLARAISRADFSEVALDLSNIAGLHSCVEAVSEGLA